MTSAGCARGISFLGAFHTVHAHGEYNYRTTKPIHLELWYPLEIGVYHPDPYPDLWYLDVRHWIDRVLSTCIWGRSVGGLFTECFNKVDVICDTGMSFSSESCNEGFSKIVWYGCWNRPTTEYDCYFEFRSLQMYAPRLATTGKWPTPKEYCTQMMMM